MKTTMLILAILTFISIGLQGSGQEENEEFGAFFKVDTMPEYRGGEEAFLKDVTAMVKYPEEAIDKGITGKVYVSFIVNKEGKVKEISIAEGVDPILDKEAWLAIIQLNKTWKAGINNGKTVNVFVTVLFDFKADKTINVTLVSPPDVYIYGFLQVN